MRPRIEELANEAIDGLGRRPYVDLLRDYALPIPIAVIAEMLGVDARDRHRFRRWSMAIAALSPPGGWIRSVPSVWPFLRFMRRLVCDRRSKPRNDLVSALVEARVGAERLADDELMSTILLLIVAGHETIVNLIANGKLALIDNPDQIRTLRDNPALIKSVVEELLRFTAPVDTASERYTREDVTISGVTIPKGSLVLAAIASANRDDAHFEIPAMLEITREPTGIWRLAWESIFAWVLPWRGWKARSRSTRSWPAPTHCVSPSDGMH